MPDMKLGYLLRGLTDAAFNREMDITRVTADSRRVTPGCAFVCIHDGEKGRGYLREAADNGAAVLICTPELAAGFSGVPGPCAIGCETPRSVLSYLYGRLAGEPWKSLRLIGVTGTNGKTTTAFMLYTLLIRMGRRCGFIGTTGCLCMGAECAPRDVYAADRFRTMTTPDPEFLYPVLQYMKECSIEFVILEVSSHALRQHKLDPLFFEAALFTNLTPEHLDFHPDMHDYYQTKLSLFSRCRIGLFNADDDYSAQAYADCACRRRVLCSARFGADYSVDGVDMTADGTTYRLCHGENSVRVSTRMPGDPGLYDSLMACACAAELMTGLEPLGDAAVNLQSAEGRMQKVSPAACDISVYIDYAHTPAALEALLKTALGFRVRGQRLVLLFGCGGDRDRSKRAEMGRIASEYADFTYITSDNSRGESAAGIIREIMTGFDSRRPHKILRDRRAAIEAAVTDALPGDIILLAGKGHEKYEITSEGRKPFDEAAIVRSALRERARQK